MTTTDPRRITLVTRGPNATRDWDDSRNAPSRLIVLEAYTVLRYALAGGVSEFSHDVERVVLDRSATAAQYLDLLASLPQGFTGDVLYINHDDSAYLSAMGRGGDRILYALTSSDLRFYLDTHALLAAPLAA